MPRRDLERLKGELLGLADSLGRVPNLGEFTRHAQVSDSTIRKHFGSWHEFLKAARASEGSGKSAEQSRTTDPEEAAAAKIHRIRESAKSVRGELRAVVKDLERRNSKLEEANAFLAGLHDLAIDDKPKPITLTGSKRKGLPEATYLALASDWHMGERVRPETVGWRNEYNPEIAQERAEQFFKSNLTMLNAARSAWHVNQGVLWLGGDLMTGYIHEEYEEENFLSPTEEAILVFETMTRGIDFLLAESDLERIILPTSNGNHGRTGQKKRIASDYRNSYEYMLYRFLAMHYKDEPRLDFKLGQGYYVNLDIYDLRARFSHGDAVRSSGGVGGIAPALYRRIGRQAEGGWVVDLDCQGHIHQFQNPRKVLINGSLIGWNAFAEWIGAAPEPPMQASAVIDSKNTLVSNVNPILVEKKR